MGTATHFLLFAGALFLLSAAITWVMIRAPIIDQPNQRSSHKQPVPRSGGVAIVITTYVGVAAFLYFEDHFPAIGMPLYGLAAGAVIIAVAGFLDDLNVITGFKSKLLFQILACVPVLYLGGGIDRISLPFIGWLDLGWLGYPVTMLWILGLTNIVNFMDGLDGLAAGTVATAAAIFGAISLGQGAHFLSAMGFVVSAACTGFFIFNFPRAWIFMGDVGSQFLGFVMAALVVLTMVPDPAPVSLFVIPLLFFHFIFDTVFTFCRRLMARENVTQAHRSHLYQLLNQIGCSHAQVSMLHMLMAIAQGMGAVALLTMPAADQFLIFLPFVGFQLVYAAVILLMARRRNLL